MDLVGFINKPSDSFEKRLQGSRKNYWRTVQWSYSRLTFIARLSIRSTAFQYISQAVRRVITARLVKKGICSGYRKSRFLGSFLDTLTSFFNTRATVSTVAPQVPQAPQRDPWKPSIFPRAIANTGGPKLGHAELRERRFRRRLTGRRTPPGLRSVLSPRESGNARYPALSTRNFLRLRLRNYCCSSHRK